MPKPYLWLIDHFGHLFRALPNSKKLYPVDSIGIVVDEFKRVCATKHGAWILALDHNIYVFVQSSEIPIRVQETTYENERWRPINGEYSDANRLITDRDHWSDITGKVSQPKDNFKLPSDNWTWEDDWIIDENFHGQITDRGGWQYAVDFPATWTAEKHWKSFVRRRKWIRFRRYNAIDKWAKLPSLKHNELREPFTDLAVGGWALSGRKDEEMSVWAVTLNGEVLVRAGVKYTCPEGESWQMIPVSREVSSISVGPTGNVWAVTCDGCVFVRKNISRTNLYGDSWELVEYPDKENRLLTVAVGSNAVWAVTRQGKVYFRKDVHSSYGVAGTDWIEMVGEMSFVGLGGQDQVYAIGLTDSLLYYRTGVTKNDLSGKTWQPLYFVDSNVSLSCSESDSSSQLSLFSMTDKQFFDSTESEGTTSLSSSYNSHQSGQMSDLTDGPKGVLSMPSGGVVPKSGFRTDTKVSQVTENQNIIEKEVRNSCQNYCTESTKTNVIKAEGFSSTSEGGKADTDSGHQQENSKQLFVSDGTSHKGNASLPKKSCNASHDGSAEESLPPLHENHYSANKNVKEQYSENKSLKTDETMPHLDENYFSERESVGNKLLNKAPLQSPEGTNVISNANSPDGASEKIFNFVTDLMDSDETESDKLEESDAENSDIVSDTTLKDLSLQCEQSSRHLQNVLDTTDSSNSINSESITSSVPYPTDVEELPDKTDQTVGSILSQSYDSLRPSLTNLASMSEELYEDYGEIVDNKWFTVGAEFCYLESPDKCPWFTIPKEVIQTKKCDINMVLRLKIMKRLIDRNKREVDSFGDFQQAVDKQTWLKKASMKYCLNEKCNQWTRCNIEFEQSSSSKLDSKFTIQYMFGKKQVLMQFPVKDILCTWRTINNNHQWTFALHTIRTVPHLVPVMFSVREEQEMLDWMNALHYTIVPTQILRNPVGIGSLWATTFLHDIFVCPAEKLKKITDMHHMQIGGHMKMIETCPLGITWALGHDGNPYVYTGGCGGGIFKGLSESPKGIYPQTDKAAVAVFKKEKWYPVTGYVAVDLVEVRMHHGKEELIYHKSCDDVKLPSGQCHWISDWAIDYSPPGGADTSGWQYAPDFNRTFHSQKGFSDYVRRMKLCRPYQINTSGPWRDFSSVPLIDISIQTNPSSGDQKYIHVWAVSTGGEVLCRTGVTLSNPQGDSWLHINTDQPFCSVSIGGKNRVWAIGKDGSAWFRNGVDQDNLAGKLWLQIVPPPPTDALLKQVSVGKTSVWATDDKGCLWYRENITPTYPEGTEWKNVADKVNTVSVGPCDQVWITTDAEFGSKSKSPKGFIYRRLGIKEEDMTGTSWESVTGGGFNHLSIRGKLN